MAIPDRKKETVLNCLMTFALLAATLYRKPELLFQPRFFAEEGTFFFAYAYNNTFIDNLLHPQFGYYTLYNAIITSFAASFSLENAPLVTTFAALLMQLAVSGYLIWSDLPLLNSSLKRFLAAISLPLLCPGQIWLNTIGVQYWLCILTSLILLEEPAARLRPAHAGKVALLLLTGLTGILSCLMTPLFIYKWFTCRARQMLLYGATLSLCSALQLLIFLQSYLQADSGLRMRFVERFLPFTLYDAVISFFNSYLLSSWSLGLLMETNFRLLLDRILFTICSQQALRQCESIYFLVGLVSAMVMLPLIWKALRHLDRRLLVLATLLIYPFSVLLSISSVGGPRYVFAPSAMLLFVVIASCDNQQINVWYRRLLCGFFLLFVVTHSMDFRTLSMYKAYQKGWPKWKDEVVLWRSDPNHQLRIWPPPWTIQLRARASSQR